MKILPIAEAKAKLSQAAVLVSHDEFESWQETATVLSDPEFRDQIRAGVKALRARRAKTFRGRELDRLFRPTR